MYADPKPLNMAMTRSWSQNSMYTTSYHDMSNQKVNVPRKSYAIPGYAGFVPNKIEGSLGQSYTKFTRQSYDKEDQAQKT